MDINQSRAVLAHRHLFALDDCIREQGDIENTLPVFTTSPFDMDVNYCLHCHVIAFRPAMIGHRAKNCTTQRPAVTAVNRPEIIRSTLLVPMPPEGQARSLRQLIIALSHVASTQANWPTHRARRDDLLMQIHDAMTNSKVPVPHESWYRAVSAFCAVNWVFYRHSARKPYSIMNAEFAPHMNSNEQPIDFLGRATPAVLGLISFSDIWDQTKAALRKIHDDFEEVFENS